MSLQLVPVDANAPNNGTSRRGANSFGSGVTAAVATPTHLVLGQNTGDLRVYSKQDHVLERAMRAVPSVSRRRDAPVTVLTYLARTDLIAAVCESRCALHDLRTRKVVQEFDSRSARFVVGALNSSGLPRLVVGSAYKVRIYRADKITTQVIDTPKSQKLRAICRLSQTEILAAIGTGTPKLWKLDLDSEAWKPFTMLPPQPFARAHKFTMCVLGSSTHSNDNASSSSGSIFIGSSLGSVLMSRSPLKVIKQEPNSGFTSVAITYSEPTGIALLITHDSKDLKVINPATGTVLASIASSSALLASQSENSPTLAMGEVLSEVHFKLTLDSIVSFSRHEASSLGFNMSAHRLNSNTDQEAQLIDLQSDEAAQLFENGFLEESMRIFTWIEEQSDKIYTVHRVLDLVSTYLEQNPNENKSESGSVFSTRTIIKSPLDTVVSYLAFLRRKLRLRGGSESRSPSEQEDISAIDTALFLCYIHMKSPLIIPLLRSKNSCNSLTVREELLELGKWRELVWFLRSRGEHREALQLLSSHKDPPESIVSYLETVNDLDLVFEFAKPVLLQRPDLSRRLFFEYTDGAQVTKIFNFLISINEDIASEFAIFRVVTGDTTPALHNAVVRALAGPPPKPNDILGSADQFIQTSQHIQPRSLLKQPCNLPLECQALLHERLGEYETAVDILVRTDDLQRATKCAENHRITSYLFKQLPDSKVPEFLNIVSPSSDLEIQAVLPKIGEANARDVMDFLAKFVIAADNRRRTAAMNESVRRAALAEYSVELSERKSAKYTVEPMAACYICHKRLGRAISAATSQGIAHYACYMDQKRHWQNVQ